MDKIANKKCLICSENTGLSKKIQELLLTMHYDVTIATSLGDASLHISNTFFNLVVVDEILSSDNEAGSKLLRILNFIPPEKRRKTFDVLLSSTYKTKDSYAAFIQGTNVIINKNDIEKFITIITEELENHHKMYALIEEVYDQLE